MKKRIGAFFMAFVFVLGMISGCMPDTVWADGDGQEPTGLVINAYDIDWSGETPQFKEDGTNWNKELEWSITGSMTARLKNNSQEIVNADELTLAYYGQEGQEGQEEISDVGEVTDIADTGLVQVTFNKIGIYKLYMNSEKADAVSIQVGYGSAGFYTEKTRTVENLIQYGKEHNVTDFQNIYFIVETPENSSWDKKLTWDVWADGNEIKDSAEQEKYFTVSEENSDTGFVIYKVTPQNGTFRHLSINASAQNSENGLEFAEGLDLFYDGEITGFNATMMDLDVQEEPAEWSKYFDSIVTDWVRISFSTYDGKNRKYYAADELKCREKDGTDAGDTLLKRNTSDARYVELMFQKPGIYEFYPDGNEQEMVTVKVHMPSVAFYKNQEATVENIYPLSGSSGSYEDMKRDGSKDVVLYMIPNFEDMPTFDHFEFKIKSWNETAEKEATEDYYTYEKLDPNDETKGYKIIVKKKKQESFGIIVNAVYKDAEWKSSAYVDSEYVGAYSGLTVKSWIIEDENGIFQLHPDSGWEKEIWMYTTDIRKPLYFAETQENGTQTVITENLVLLKDGTKIAELEKDKKNPNFVVLTISEAGNYKIAVKGKESDAVALRVDEPHLGFYSKEDGKRENFLYDIVVKSNSSENRIFYLVTHPDPDCEMKDFHFEAVVEENGKEKIVQEGTYFTTEAVKEGKIYRITISDSDKLPDDFDIIATAKQYNIQDENDVWQPEMGVSVHVDKTNTGGNTGGGSSSGGSSSGGTSVITPAPSSSQNVAVNTTETKSGTTTNSTGNIVKTETTTVKNADGTTASTTTRSEIVDVAKNTTAIVTVKKNAEGIVSVAEAAVENVVEAGTHVTVKTTISAKVVKQVTEAAGTTELTIKQTVKDSDGNVRYVIEVNAEDLTAGEKLTLVKVENGKKILVTKPLTVTKNGNVNVKAQEGTYQLLNDSDATKLKKEILDTVQPAKKNCTVEKGKKTTVKLSKKLDMDNVAKVTYTTSKKSVVKVNKNGKVIAKKNGTATIKMTVTLKDGTKKIVKTKVTVK